MRNLRYCYLSYVGFLTETLKGDDSLYKVVRLDGVLRRQPTKIDLWRVPKLIIICFYLIFLISCGQKGELYLPDEVVQKPKSDAPQQAVPAQ